MAYKYPICGVIHWFCKIARFFATEPHCLASFGSVHFSLLGVIECCTFTGIHPFMPWNTCFKSASFQTKAWASILSITGRHSLFETSLSRLHHWWVSRLIYPFCGSVYGLPSSVLKDTFNALGAIYRPEIALSVCHPVWVTRIAVSHAILAQVYHTVFTWLM
jgi:hypothetical protein